MIRGGVAHCKGRKFDGLVRLVAILPFDKLAHVDSGD